DASSEAYAMIKMVSGYRHKEGRNVDAKREVTRVGDKKAEAVSISPQQARALKQQSNTPQGRRDALLMCLLLDHGLRCGEVADLTPTNVSLSQGLLTFRREKVKKVQKHQLTGETLLALLRYDEVATPGERLLLGSRKGHEGVHLEGTMSRRAITKRVGTLGTRLGITGL